MTIQLFSFGTSNGRKISVALEEMGLTSLDHRFIQELRAARFRSMEK